MDMPYVHTSRRATGSIQVCTHTHTHTHTYIHTMEYYSAIKKDKVLPFAATWMDSEGVMFRVGFPGGSVGKESTHSAGDVGLIATLSSILAWRIPWIEELGVLQSIGTQRIGLG